jgi:hypothetical protein
VRIAANVVEEDFCKDAANIETDKLGSKRWEKWETRRPEQ